MMINVLEYFEGGALARMPEKTAIVDADKRYNFRELEVHAKAFAAAIRARTDAIRHPIAVFLPKCAETIFADLGIVYTGNCYANLDIKLPAIRLKAILDNLDAPLIVTNAALASSLNAVGIDDKRILLIDDVGHTDHASSNVELDWCLDNIIDTDPLCIIHTSGSTGVPKGVALNHRATIDFMDWAFERLALDGSETIGSLSPLYFDIYSLELFLCLAKGATISLIPEQIAAFPASLLQHLIDQNISFIFWVPTIMVNIANQALLERLPPVALKKILFAGEIFPTRPLNIWRKHLPQAMFVNLYGPIEATVDCTYFIVERDFGDDEKLPIGFPCRNSDVLILTDEGRAARIGEHGELCVRGSSLALGYWNNPRKTADAFTMNPLQPHYPDRLYRTGDTVYRNERGEIMFVGRRDYQIKHLGYRIELGEIEHAALQIEGIAQACVVYDSAKKQIALYFESDENVSAAAIRTALGARLPKYMLPTAFVRIDSMPRNPNGKIDRLALSQKQAAPRPAVEA
ncbi:amino acid adenylation domain-containing protein [Caballeronia sp. LP006]|uniref:amino acid adenylation domain-containing protein n=1 Tax=Caballeronia sp. LP006 TaxID=3038552 RepID=UPI0028674DB6|nr:amino acid adenylation domain-containing protein [Caballeronia sp. LP006]MDR5829790.1 amino acid adenylation domain-containing protein [Caballeronia sp. LP006]